MKKRVLMIAALVSGTLAISGCTTNPYTGEREAGKSGIGAGIGSLVGAGVGALSSSKHDRGKGALIGAAAGAALGGGIGYYMDVQEAKLRDKMQGTGVSVTRNGDNIVLNMPNNVTFDSNSANLKPAGANTLTGVAMVLKEYEKTAVNVVGYTDSTGSKDLNMRLSQQRADSVASALITQGVAANRIRTTGMGPANPIASNSTAEGKAQNRRVEITLSPLQYAQPHVARQPLCRAKCLISLFFALRCWQIFSKGSHHGESGACNYQRCGESRKDRQNQHFTLS